MPDYRSVIHLYARGWEHAGWEGGFYPDDLPVEWRLSYYANEFSGVLVPEDAWRGADARVLAGWAGEVPPAFRFFLERPASLPDEAETRHARCLGSRFAGWVLPGARSGEIERCRLIDAPMPGGACRLHTPEAPDLRRLRSLFERLAVEAVAEGQRELTLFAAGDPPPMRALRSMRQLLELLRLA